MTLRRVHLAVSFCLFNDTSTSVYFIFCTFNTVSRKHILCKRKYQQQKIPTEKIVEQTSSSIKEFVVRHNSKKLFGIETLTYSGVSVRLIDAK